jgi:hypothetical protein
VGKSNRDEAIREITQFFGLQHCQYVNVARRIAIKSLKNSLVFLYSSVNDKIAHNTVQLQPNDRLCGVLII